MRDDEICVRPGGICSHHSVCEGCGHLRKKEKAQMEHPWWHNPQKFLDDMQKLIQAAKMLDMVYCAKLAYEKESIRISREVAIAIVRGDYGLANKLGEESKSRTGSFVLDDVLAGLHEALKPFRGNEK